jgi:hypothetical protein
MPTQFTYCCPGHHWRTAGSLPGSVALTVHSQVTLDAPTARNTSTTCRQAAMKSAGEAWVLPHWYQLPFISCPNAITTG